MIFMNSLSPSFLLKEKETFFHFCDTHIDACPGLPTDVSVIVAGIFNMNMDSLLLVQAEEASSLGVVLKILSNEDSHVS